MVSAHEDNEGKDKHDPALTPIGVSPCTQHPEYKMHWICMEPECSRAPVCLLCQHDGVHAGHRYVDIMYAQTEERNALHDSLVSVQNARTLLEAKLDAVPSPESPREVLLQRDLDRVRIELHESVARRCDEAEEEVRRGGLQRQWEMLRSEWHVEGLKKLEVRTKQLRSAHAAQVVVDGPALRSLTAETLRALPPTEPLVHSVSPKAAMRALSQHHLILRTNGGTEHNPPEFEPFKKMIASDPTLSAPYAHLAFAMPSSGYTRLYDGTEMTRLDLYRRVVQLDPQDSTSLCNLALLLPAKGTVVLEGTTTPVSKEELLKRSIQLNPNACLAFYNLALSLAPGEMATLGNGDKMDKTALFKRAIHLNPNCSHAYVGLGFGVRSGETVVLEDGVEMTQERLFVRAVHLSPQESLFWNNLGVVLPDDGKVTLEDGTEMTTIDIYKRALHLDPHSSRILLNLAKTLPNNEPTTLQDGRSMNREELKEEAARMCERYSGA